MQKGTYMQKMNIIETIGNNIQEIRLKKNISLEKLSAKCGINKEVLENFEIGKNTGIAIWHYKDIANALGVDIEDITKGLVFVEN